MPVIYEIGDGEGCNLSDQDELLHQDDTDSTSDSEDTVATCSARASLNREENGEKREEEKSVGQTMDMCVTGLSLSLSTTVLTVIYPAYLRSVTGVSTSYVAILLPSTVCCLLVAAAAALLAWKGHFAGFPLTACPLPVKRVSRGAISYAAGCCLVVLAQSPGRVPCHLQDPLKAVVILFSLLYYFFFCKKMLGLRKLFAASVLAVGLFIAADYGLCDEFKCRGTQSHLQGRWEARAVWTLLYLTGLGLFTLHFTLTEEHIHCSGEVLSNSSSNSLLSTVSRIVSQNESCEQISNGNTSQDSFRMEIDRCCLLIVQEKKSKKLCILATLWIQGVTWLFIVISGILLLIMSNFTRLNLPNESVINMTIKGLMCHMPQISFGKPVQHLVSSSPIEFNKKNDDYFNHIHSNFHNREDSNMHSRNKFERYLEHLHLYNTESRTTVAKKILETNHIIRKKHDFQKLHNDSSISKAYHKRKTIQKENNKKRKRNHKKDIDHDENIQKKENISGVNFRLKEKQLPLKVRVKRKAVESLASGFKIIQPTISILKDHIITNKMKPNLIGHIILNKTNANINGHKMAINFENLYRNPDSLQSYYQRRNRNGPKTVSSIKFEDLSLSKKVYVKIANSKNMHVKNVKIKNKTNYTPRENELNRNKRSPLFISDDSSSKNVSRYLQHLNSINNISKTIIMDDNNMTKNDNITSNRYSNHVNSDFLYTITKLDKNKCNYIPTYGWTVFLAYTGFSISSLRFLKLCQSSVFTIAMMTPALPLTGIWWAVFTHTTDGGLIVEPTISGELICALLSLPIILLGLTLLFKAQLNQSFSGYTSGVSSQNYLSR